MMVALSQNQNIFLTHFWAQNFDIHIIWLPTLVQWRPNRKQNSLILCRRLPYKEFDWNSDRLRFWVGRRKSFLIPIFGILLSLEVAKTRFVNASITIIIHSHHHLVTSLVTASNWLPKMSITMLSVLRGNQEVKKITLTLYKKLWTLYFIILGTQICYKLDQALLVMSDPLHWKGW